MAQYSENDIRDAEYIVDSLTINRRKTYTPTKKPENGRRENVRQDIHLDSDLAIADIEANTKEFLTDLDVLKALGVPMPAIRLKDWEGGKEELVPASLSTLLGIPDNGLSSERFSIRSHFSKLVHDFILNINEQNLQENTVTGLETISLDEADSTFRRLAKNFLSTRIAAVRRARDKKNSARVESNATIMNLFQRAGGSGIRVMTPGCTFSVSTNTYGLRVLCSGAYYVTGNFFAHPTSPAAGILQSGTYVFGVDGGKYTTPQWDTMHVTLPGASAVHLNF